MNFDSVQKIAAAILYEGYILYPYRSTAIKNRQRWNFGTLYPRHYAEQQRPVEPFRFVVECLVARAANASLDVKINFLQLVRRQRNPACDSTTRRALSDPSLDWEEAVERTSVHRNLLLNDLVLSPLVLTLRMNEFDLAASAGEELARPLEAILMISAEVLSDGACKLHLEFENVSPLPGDSSAKRDEALPLSFVSAHALLGIAGGEFISQLDPPQAYCESSANCCSVGVFPVLAGDQPERNIMLCSPIILYDYPKIAPESAGDFFDGTEMDEMLTLRVLTLSDAEKQEMREGDPRARRILERTEALTPQDLLKAHGVIRGMREICEDTQ